MISQVLTQGARTFTMSACVILFSVCFFLSHTSNGQNVNPKLDWDSFLKATDRSSLANNMVASHNPSPHAWEHFSEAQSAFGRVVVPEVLGIHTGHIYTANGSNSLSLQTINNETWLPWIYTGKNDNINVSRSVIKDTFGSKISLTKKGKGLLIIELNKFTDHYYKNFSKVQIKINHEANNQITLTWKTFTINISFLGTKKILYSHDPEPILGKFQNGADTLFNDQSVLNHFERNGELFAGAIFENDMEVVIEVTKNNDLPHAIKFDDIVSSSRKFWIDFFENKIPNVITKSDLIINTYYLAWNTFWSNRSEGGSGMTPYPYISSSKFMYPMQFYWDEGFHAVILSYLKDKNLTYQYLKNFAYSQAKDGGMPGSVSITKDHDEYMKWANDSGTYDMQPPIISIILQYLKNKSGWPTNLREVYDVYSKNIDWLYSKSRDTDQDGILEYNNSYQSGCDNSPRWDGRYLKENELGPMHPVEAIDLNCWLVNLHLILGEMANSLGLTAQSKHHHEKATALQSKIEALMWNEADGFYYDLDAKTNEQLKVKSQMAFSALHLPNAKPERIKRMVNEHLINPKEFWVKYPVPGVSIDSKSFSETDMWKGPVWININWMIIDGLEKQGHHDIARELAFKTISLVGPKYAKNKMTRSARFNEWFNPITGKPLGNENVSWSCMVIDLIQRFDWSETSNDH